MGGEFLRSRRVVRKLAVAMDDPWTNTGSAALSDSEIELGIAGKSLQYEAERKHLSPSVAALQGLTGHGTLSFLFLHTTSRRRRHGQQNVRAAPVFQPTDVHRRPEKLSPGTGQSFYTAQQPRRVLLGHC